MAGQLKRQACPGLFGVATEYQKSARRDREATGDLLLQGVEKPTTAQAGGQEFVLAGKLAEFLGKWIQIVPLEWRGVAWTGFGRGPEGNCRQEQAEWADELEARNIDPGSQKQG